MVTISLSEVDPSAIIALVGLLDDEEKRIAAAREHQDRLTRWSLSTGADTALQPLEASPDVTEVVRDLFDKAQGRQARAGLNPAGVLCATGPWSSLYKKSEAGMRPARLHHIVLESLDMGSYNSVSIFLLDDDLYVGPSDDLSPYSAAEFARYAAVHLFNLKPAERMPPRRSKKRWWQSR